jgi:hypothetical protein
MEILHLFRITIFDARVKPKKQAYGESSSIFQLIDQLEHIADKLLAG